MNTVVFPTEESQYRLTPDDPRARHIRTVLRAGTGAAIRLAAVSQRLGEGTVTILDDGTVVVDAVWRRPTPPPHPVTVVVGHPRPPVLQRLWRDLTAMRVRRIAVFAADLTERSYLESSVWRRVDELLREGMSQGGHGTPPQVTRHGGLEAALAAISSSGSRLYGALDPDAEPLASAVAAAVERSPAETDVAVVIGPERGFSDRETQLLRKAGATPVRLGDTILRTETATAILTGAVCAAFPAG